MACSKSTAAPNPVLLLTAMSPATPYSGRLPCAVTTADCVDTVPPRLPLLDTAALFVAAAGARSQRGWSFVSRFSCPSDASDNIRRSSIKPTTLEPRLRTTPRNGYPPRTYDGTLNDHAMTATSPPRLLICIFC
ncbi:hypothetical protein P171DRAFT_35730 [Karstenula rhodostoma CBS 690.94]|uniref:Uncharacterized protein n=1 Tax=Karstenula rhodostoma CBS 690.94 TaxID=1392251 RepID=A0A9P4UBH8_9PLEO|nr:hypothetical protein P171DRAFT_35730 [Karstenula rhodostoma CBS 690.94]